MLQVALNGLENILRLGEQEVKTTGAANPYAVIIEEVFGLDKIEFLQSHENMEIYQKAFDIIERYFGTEEEDKDVSELCPGNISSFSSLLFTDCPCSRLQSVHLWFRRRKSADTARL